VRLVLRPGDEARVGAMARAARHLLRTPGNPPLPPPADGQGLMGTPTTRLLERRHAPFAELVKTEIRERRQNGGAGDDGLLARLAATDLDPEDIVEELTILTAAATEATASGLTSVLEHLAHHPDLAAQLAVTDGDDPGFGPAVNESLRLRPVAMAAMRRLTRPLAVGGHQLSAGTVLMVPSLLLHRDPAHFPEPDTFLPDRFRDGAYGPFSRSAAASVRASAAIWARRRSVRWFPPSCAPGGCARSPASRSASSSAQPFLRLAAARSSPLHDLPRPATLGRVSCSEASSHNRSLGAPPRSRRRAATAQPAPCATARRNPGDGARTPRRPARRPPCRCCCGRHGPCAR
jgi:hypothetical protein